MYSSNSDNKDNISITNIGSEGQGSSKTAGHVSTVTRCVELPTGSPNGRGCVFSPNPIRRQLGEGAAAVSATGGGTYYTCHVRQCPAIKRCLGVRLWPAVAVSLCGKRRIYASKDMHDKDWEGCLCGLYIQNRFNLNESTLSPAGAKKFEVEDLVWVNGDLKPLRTWSRGGMSRKRKMYKSDGTGRFRDISLSPVSDLECACDMTRRAALLQLNSGSDNNNDVIYRNNLYNLVSKPNNLRKKIRLDLVSNVVTREVPDKETPGRLMASVRPRSSSGNASTSSSPSKGEGKRQKVGFGPTQVVGSDNLKQKKKRSRLSGAARRQRAKADLQAKSVNVDVPSAPPMSGARLHPQTIHMGNHSVTGQGVLSFAPDWNENKAAQNVIGFISRNLPAWGANIATDAATAALTIRTRYAIQSMGIQPRNGVVEATTPRTIAADWQLEPIVLNFTGGREIIYRLKDSDAADLIHNEAVDARRLAGVMNIGPHFPIPVIDRIAPLLLQRREKINNASMYGLGWLAVHQLHALELLNVAPVYRAVLADAMVLRNTIVAAGDQQAALINHFETDLAVGRIFIDGRGFTLDELAFLARIASGGPLITSPAAARRSVLQYVETAQIPMAVYTQDVIVIPALVPAAWSSVRVEVLMRKLANHLDETDAWLQGYMRACTIVRGVATEWHDEAEPPVVTRRWVNALFEICGTAWPLPGGTNPMWQWAGIKPVFVKNQGNEQEIAVLGSMTVHESVTAAHVIGQLMSTGITTLFIKLNLTTVQFNSRYFGLLASDGGELLRTLLMSRLGAEASEADCPLMIRAGVNWVSEFSGMSIDWTNFSSVVWNNRDTAADAEAAAAARMWTLLPPGSPRIGSVLAVGFLLDAYPDVWCMLGPAITVNTAEDIVHGELPRYWSAALGDNTYAANASSVAPYQYVTYGATLLGALRQQLGVEANWPVQMRRFNQVIRAGAMAPGARGPPLVPIEWVPNLGVAQPGTFQTYDWGNRTVLAPEMTEDVLGENVFSYVADNGQMTYHNAGVRATRPLANRRLDATLAGLSLFCKPLAGAKAGPVAAKEEQVVVPEKEN